LYNTKMVGNLGTKEPSIEQKFRERDIVLAAGPDLTTSHEPNSTALGRVPCASFEVGEADAELS
jgi:hypothetical protein